jgi:hypothetical protein
MCVDHTHSHPHPPRMSPPPGDHLDTRIDAELSRRGLLTAGGGLLLAAAASGALTTATSASAAATVSTGAGRLSRLTRGTTLVHADLHNHTLLSDGDGDPAAAFASMRAAGLDVAALTDHATLSDNLLGDALQGLLPPEYTQLGGLTPEGWRRTGRLADAANRDGRFTAIRGFEWSEPALGHVNVWFSRSYVDVLQAGTMQPFYEWLLRDAGLAAADLVGTGLVDGGDDGLAGFNHPGREQGRFQEFTYDARLQGRFVSMEIFNRTDDYLFEGYADGRSSPLCACLNAGWKTGLSGVTDEHGTDWGFPEGKGRTGVWVKQHSRAGVREAMRARRFFATRTSGLRVDAVLEMAGRTHRMGRTLPVSRGLATFRLDLARGRSWLGKRLDVQVLRPGPEVPEVVQVVPFRVGQPITFRCRLNAADGDWVVLRVSDPEQRNATPGPAGHPCNDFGVAYTSPWWLTTA